MTKVTQQQQQHPALLKHSSESRLESGKIAWDPSQEALGHCEFDCPFTGKDTTESFEGRQCDALMLQKAVPDAGDRKERASKEKD